MVEDLRSAKSMIKLYCEDDNNGDALQKAEEYLANVESYVITEGEKVFGSEKVNEWFRRLEMANTEVFKGKSDCDKFVTGVPRDQKWIRIEPVSDLPAEKIEATAKTHNMLFKRQTDGRLIVYGQAEDLKAFLKAISCIGLRK